MRLTWIGRRYDAIVNSFRGNVESDPLRRWDYWLKNKKTEIRIRTYLSIVLSVILVALVVFREWKELNRAGAFFSAPEWVFVLSCAALPAVWWRYRRICIIHGWRRAGWREHLAFSANLGAVVVGFVFIRPTVQPKLATASAQQRLDLLVVIIILGTVAAAGWEVFGEKLHSSHRDASFLQKMRLLLRRADEFQAKGTDVSATEVGEFIAAVLDAACKTLCGRTEVAAGWFAARNNVLRLVEATSNANYFEELAIPLDLPGEGPGPAAVAHKLSERRIVYMPDKETEEAWCILPIEGEGDRFRYPAPVKAGWYSTPDPKFEDFRSVLCVPVRFRLGEDELKMGVLAFSTKKRDPFLNRDFVMAECFANILAQLLAFKEKSFPSASTNIEADE